MSEEAVLREAICRFGRSIFERGLTSGSSGNISARLSDGRWVATPTNSSLGWLDPARLSLMEAGGKLISGDPPTKELPLHLALYETRHGAGAIVHLHSTHSVAVSMLQDIDAQNVLPPLTAYYLMRVGRTALVPYYRPGDPAVADAIRGLAGRYSSVLLSNHGPVVSGKDLEAAVYATEELEDTAKLHLLLRGLNPRLLTRDQVRDLVEHFRLDEAIAGDGDGAPHDHHH
ncbi:aldolase [Xanthobacteraceae bacterium Astr-EGSB]|uniref:3-oxo-tetronate 4-phosphate decarboxylase n=1 Tax=Astrobacterium formosum TaxID=3069710 RepID=UPI0027B5AF10|nr:aldolase [Xanthobacteraceae bacterium Astr-EGSB]